MSLSTTERLRRAERYLSAMGPAVEGCGGDEHTYKACKVGIGFDLGESEFLPILLGWSRSCQPPWDERQLERKLASVYRKSTKERGSLCQEERTANDPTPPKKSTPPKYPPPHEVIDFWTHSCITVTQVPEVMRWLESRGLKYAELGEHPRLAVAGLVPPTGRVTWPAWAFWGDRPWYTTSYRAVIPLFDSAGHMCSFKVRAIAETNGPKSVPPQNLDVARLFMANPVLAFVLRTGTWPDQVPPEQRQIFAAEGEPDWLSLLVAVRRSKKPQAGVLGYFAGSWSFDLFKRLPEGTRIVAYSQEDSAGAAYIDKLRATFQPILLTRRIEIHQPKRKEQVRGA